MAWQRERKGKREREREREKERKKERKKERQSFITKSEVVSRAAAERREQI
jgi:hypothetical protein